MIKIANAASGIQADQIVDFLKSNGIIAIKNGVGSGGYMAIVSGMSTAGFDILVPENKAEEAKTLISQLLSSEEEGDTETLNKPADWKRMVIRIWAILVLAAFVIGIVLSFWN